MVVDTFSPEPAVAGQPAVSIARRQSSILTPTTAGDIPTQTEEITPLTSVPTAADEEQLSITEPAETNVPTNSEMISTVADITETPPPASGGAPVDTQVPSNTPVIPTTAVPPADIPSPTETTIPTLDPEAEDLPPAVCDPGASSALKQK